jgi:hypothetical protein
VHIGIGIGIAASGHSATAPASQSTSVNANGSLAMARFTGLPSGAYTFTAQIRSSALTGPATQAIFRAATDLGSIEVTRVSGTLVGSIGAIGNIGPVNYTGWGALSVDWSGTPGTATTISFTPAGGATTTITSTSRLHIWEAYVLGISWQPATQPDQVRAATVIIYNGQLTPTELVASRSSFEPVDTGLPGGSGATVNSFASMSDASTAGEDESGNGNDWTTAGTGVTVADSPY